MRYLVNRETKEHEVYDGQHYDATKYRVIEADAEGWIKWYGGDCPLPDDDLVEMRWTTGLRITRGSAEGWNWTHPALTHYRPILDKPESVVKESLTTEQRYGKADGYVPAVEYDTRSVSFNVLKRLEAAHEAAQKIPDLEAELREALGKMGYDLVARDPFVERTDYEKDVAESATDSETTKEEHVRVAQEPTTRKTEIVFSSAPQSVRYGEGMMVADIAVTKDETMTVVCHESVNEQVAHILYHGLKRHEVIVAEPTEDMSDWRNWREGDLVVLQDFAPEGYYFKRGKTYRVRHVSDRGYTIQASSMHDISICRRNNDFRFHSRPEQSK